MPAYLFTYHAHASWMPDHQRGYVHRQKGLQPPDADMAAAYRAKQKSPPVVFDSSVQQIIIEIARGAGAHLDAVVRAVFSEPTHAHVLATWKHRRPWMAMRTSIRGALSRALNDAFGKRDWFADNPSRRRVRDYDHFDYLVLVYAAKHRGAVWRDAATLRNCAARDAKRPVSVTKRRPRRK